MGNVRKWCVASMLLGALLAAGCSKNAPCSTDPSKIETARADVQTATAKAQGSKTELSAAEQKKTELTRQVAALPDPKELQAKLEELKKGSGR